MASSVTAASVANAANGAASPTGDAFKQLSFYLAKNEVALYPKWNVYDTLFGSIKWEPNMGSTLTGTTPTPSPVLRTTFMPEILTAFPLKDQFTVGERTEDAMLGMHRFESNRFRFLSNFESFWRDHLSYAQSDIVRQIQCANNVFIRTLMYYQAPDLYISGKGLSSQVTHGTGIGKTSLTQANIRTIQNGIDTTAATSAAIDKSSGTLFRNDIATGGAVASTSTSTAGVLTLKEIFKAMLVLQEDIQAPTFDQTYGAPKTSEMVKGKYVLICSTEAWASLLWDDSLRSATSYAGTAASPTANQVRTTTLAPANLNLLQDGFAGDLFGKITAKFDPYPMRFDHDGQLVVPQAVTAGDKVVPNPAYTAIGDGTGAGAAGTLNADGNASHEIAFLVGADAFKTINVGPPPKEFAGKNMNAKKFYGMKWNGEVTLTDQFLIPTGITGSEVGGIDGSSGSELNVYGDYLKFISQAVIGGIAGDARYCLPIIFKRQRTS